MKYRVHIRYSAEDAGFIATVPELSGCSAFGPTLDEAAREVQEAAEAWIETAHEMRRDVPDPSVERAYSGKLILRMPPELHRALDEAATDAHTSLNQYLVFVLARALGQYEAGKFAPGPAVHMRGARRLRKVR